MSDRTFNPFIRLDPRDNVVVARMGVPTGTPVPDEKPGDAPGRALRA